MNPSYDSYIPPGSYRQSSGPSKKFILLVAGLVGSLLIAGLLLIFGNAGPSTAELSARLNARLVGTQAMVEQATENLSSDELRAVNAEIGIVLSSDLANLAAYGGEPDEELVAIETDQTTLDELAEAKLQGNYDEVYRGAMSQRLEATNALVAEIYEKTNDTSLQTTLDAVYLHLGELQNRLAAD